MVIDARRIVLVQVRERLPAGLEQMRAEARAEGHRMLDTLAAEWDSGATRFARPGEALFAAYAAGTLAGIGGITQEPTIPGALRMRRFYIRPQFRRRGVGRELIIRLLDGAVGGVITANAAAGSEPFWETFGFVADRRDGYTHIRRPR